MNHTKPCPNSDIWNKAKVLTDKELKMFLKTRYKKQQVEALNEGQTRAAVAAMILSLEPDPKGKTILIGRTIAATITVTLILITLYLIWFGAITTLRNL